MKPRYKTRPPRFTQAEPGEAVWGNGCELRGCLKSSHGSFLLCPDGIRREFCADHQTEGQSEAQ